MKVCSLNTHTLLILVAPRLCAGAVGIYVPGGTAVLPSSTLMMAVPAGIAGCKTIVMATPPRPDGSITPEVLYCAKKAGVTHILKAGGAQVGGWQGGWTTKRLLCSGRLLVTWCDALPAVSRCIVLSLATGCSPLHLLL